MTWATRTATALDPETSYRLLSEADWWAKVAAHEARIDAYVEPHQARRQARLKHPVHDFLFTYYSQRPLALRRWHPGFGVVLEGAEERASWKGYVAVPGGVAVDREYVDSQQVLLQTLRRLLAATAARPAHTGCFGLHEWAMVYRLTEDETRHSQWPLRLGPVGTDEVVEGHRIACSHFDAFRFFTEPARALNTLSPGRDDRPAYEQPGCLHAGMDLYKHAFRLSPMISSELVADCFELAWEIRIMDMRAAPYDLTGVVMDHTGEEWTPVPIETAEGKREYAEAQRHFAERAAPLRQRLVDECERLLTLP